MKIEWLIDTIDRQEDMVTPWAPDRANNIFYHLLIHLKLNLLLSRRFFCLSQVSRVCMTGVIPTFCSINQFNTRELRVPFHQSTHCPFLLFPLLSTTIPRTINSSSVTYEIYKNNQINLCENFVSPKSWCWLGFNSVRGSLICQSLPRKRNV